jgi:hypothetical protein
MEHQDCVTFESDQNGSDMLTIMVTLLLLLYVIISAELNIN